MTDVSIPKEWFAKPLKLENEAQTVAAQTKRRRVRPLPPAPREGETPPADITVTVTVRHGDREVVKTQTLMPFQHAEPLEGVKAQGEMLAAQAYRELEVTRLGELADSISPRGTD